MFRIYLAIVLLHLGIILVSGALEAPAPRLEQDPERPEQMRIVWPTIPCHSYELQEASSLGSWRTVVGYPFHADSGHLSHDFVVGNSRAFFRVIDLGPPIPSVEAFFSVAGPTGNESDLTLESKIKELLLLAEPGSQVLVSIYNWTRETMADAFLEAYRRGVDVRLIIGSDYPAVEKLQNSMRPGRVLVCRNEDGIPGGCHGGRINHNKFFLFSKLSDGSCNVVVQSSANFTLLQTQMHNNLLVVRDDRSLYDTYHIYWHDLYREVEDLDYYRGETEGSTASVYFFPRKSGNGTSGENDTIVEILDELGLEAGDSIHVAMAFWSNARIGIANKLADLLAKGVDVQVIFDPNNTGGNIGKTLRAAGASVIEFPYVHSKYMLVETGRGRQRKRYILTGSHNYTNPALTSNDEVLLRMENDELYETYLTDWIRMTAHPVLK